MSPATPPPRVRSRSLRVKPFWARASYIWHTVAICLCSSPAGKTNWLTRKPAPSREAATRWPYRGNTLLSLTIITWQPGFFTWASRAPAWSRNPRWMVTA